MGFPNYLRQRNIFDPMNQMQGPQIPPVDLAGGMPNPNNIAPMQPQFGPTNIQNPGPGLPPAPPDFDPMASYHPEHDATDAYTQLMSQYPQMQEPSGKRRIGASILGALTDLGTNLGGARHAAGQRTGPKGMDVYNEVTGKNQYLEAIQDWKNKIGPAGTAANLERYSNVNERQLAYQTGQQQLAANKEKETERKNLENESVRRARQATNDFKAQHQNWKFEQGKDGTLRAFNPQNPAEFMELGKTQLSDVELYNLNQQATAQKISETGAANEHLAGVKGGIQESLQDQRAWIPIEKINPDTGQKETWKLNTITGKSEPVVDKNGVNIGPVSKIGTDAKPPSGAQERIERQLRGQQLFNTRSDLAPFMAKDNKGDWFIKPNNAWGAENIANAQKKIDEIKSILYPPGTTAGTGAPTSAIPPAPMQKNQTGPNGQSRTVYSFDGGQTWVAKQ